MAAFAIVGVFIAIVIVTILARRRAIPWSGNLQRLHAGVKNKAEWMAPDNMVQAVEADYLAAQHWMSEALMRGYGRFLQEGPRYLSGVFLKAQQRSTTYQMHKHGPCMIGVLRAHHNVRVRHFSDDGLSCYVVDHQTERRMATYECSQFRRLHTQELLEGAYVYRMVYDTASRRWKIDELIQQLPLGWNAENVYNKAIKLEKSLPIAAGRDL
ncbi:MAG: hypothetical protein IT324_27195 [Anaerolineae bacterium]|nr:hypothetical protein [Anaerolineae bacterium]